MVAVQSILPLLQAGQVYRGSSSIPRSWCQCLVVEQPIRRRGTNIGGVLQFPRLCFGWTLFQQGTCFVSRHLIHPL